MKGSDDTAFKHALKTLILEETEQELGVEAEPAEVRVTRWPLSLAQFPVGHRRHMAEMTLMLAEDAPGLVVAGAAHNGVGIPSCVRSGTEAAAAVSDRLG